MAGQKAGYKAGQKPAGDRPVAGRRLAEGRGTGFAGPVGAVLARDPGVYPLVHTGVARLAAVGAVYRLDGARRAQQYACPSSTSFL